MCTCVWQVCSFVRYIYTAYDCTLLFLITLYLIYTTNLRRLWTKIWEKENWYADMYVRVESLHGVPGMYIYSRRFLSSSVSYIQCFFRAYHSENFFMQNWCQPGFFIMGSNHIYVEHLNNTNYLPISLICFPFTYTVEIQYSEPSVLCVRYTGVVKMCAAFLKISYKSNTFSN